MRENIMNIILCIESFLFLNYLISVRNDLINNYFVKIKIVFKQKK